MRPPSIRSHTRFPSEIVDAGGEGTDEPTRRRCEYARGDPPRQAVLPAARPYGRGGDLRCGAGPRDATRYPPHSIRALRSRVLKKLPNTTSLITREPVEESFLKGPW